MTPEQPIEVLRPQEVQKRTEEFLRLKSLGTEEYQESDRAMLEARMVLMANQHLSFGKFSERVQDVVSETTSEDFRSISADELAEKLCKPVAGLM